MSLRTARHIACDFSIPKQMQFICQRPGEWCMGRKWHESSIRMRACKKILGTDVSVHLQQGLCISRC